VRLETISSAAPELLFGPQIDDPIEQADLTVAYDNRSRVSSVTDVFGQVVSYAYDANGNRTQLSLNAATSSTYQYDVINRLTQLTPEIGPLG
jgi:YD repeat-containing protein